MVTRKKVFFKIIGFAGLLLWLFIGDWGGLELAKKGFHFFKHNIALSIEILVGVIIGIVVLGWLLDKLSPGKATKRRKIGSSSPSAPAPKQSKKMVYIVDGKEFDNQQDALLFARQLHPEAPGTFIRREYR